METINANGNIVKVYADIFEYEAYDQIKRLAGYHAYDGCQIRVMPDAHAGKGCVVGTTIKLADKVTPNLVGVDIGCGMLCIKLKGSVRDRLDKFDQVIHNKIPSGFAVHSRPVIKCSDIYDNLICGEHIDMSRVSASIGTLGGGNHFIEIDYSEKEDAYYLVIHTGSRNLGVQVCNYWQNVAYKNMNEMSTIRNNLIKQLTEQGRQSEIQNALKNIKKPACCKELAHLEGSDFDSYIHDMQITQEYARMNRKAIADIILKEMNWQRADEFETIHNYIEYKNKILRKGAVSAYEGETIIIPMNMRDGSLICKGKGNPDWNFSAPHGAGRLMSRAKAKENIDMDEYTESMKGIYSSSVCRSTIDESPMAYKPMKGIIDSIGDTVDVIDIIKPIYNFKAS